MAWEYADLFDAELAAAVRPDGQLSMFDKSEASSIHVGQMGYRRRTTLAGPRLEAEIYPVFGREQRETLRAARRKETPESQRRYNEQRAIHQLGLLIDTNFTEDDYHLVLTYAGGTPTYERAEKDIRNFLAKVDRRRAKRGLSELKYIYTIGYAPGHRIHAHMIINGGISQDELEKIWGHGIEKGSCLRPDGDGYMGLAKYIFSQNDDLKQSGSLKNRKSWRRSRNLKKPKTRRRDAKCSNARVKRIALDFENEAREVMEKLYPGYTLEDCRVWHSDIVDGVYIRCVLRKWPGGRKGAYR